MPKRLKTTLLCLTLALALLLDACGKDEDSSASMSGSASADSSSISGTSDVSESASLDDSSAPPQSAAPALPVLEELPLGDFAYLDTEGLFPDDRAPQLQLLADNRAAFRVNTGNGMGTAQGNVVFQGSDLTLYIRSLELDNEEPFWGDSLQSLTFRVLDADRLEYTGAPFGLTQRMMVFARQDSAQPGAALAQGSGTAPAPDPAAQTTLQDVSGPVGTVTDVSAAAPPASSLPDGSGSLAASEPAEDESGASTGQPDASQPETEGQGLSLWVVVAIAAASAAVGGTLAVVLFVTLKKRRENKEERLAAAAEKKVQKAAQAVQKKEAAQAQKEKAAEAKEKRKARQDAKKAKGQEKKAARLAKKKDKQAVAAAKKASKAAQEAEKAAEKAAAAAEKTSRLSGKHPAEKEAPAKEEKPDDAPGAEEKGGSAWTTPSNTPRS